MKFRFNLPVKAFFGTGTVRDNAAEFKNRGGMAFIVTGKSSADSNGSLRDTVASLDECGIAWERYNGIEPNPSVENVRDAAERARKCGADFIIGIGGGSPLDASKAVAILAANDIDDDELFSTDFPVRPLPVVAIPTTAGTGSEVTPYSILTYNKISNKKSIASDLIFPALAFLDPSYTYTLGIGSTINTAVDALSHAVEGYLSVRSSAMIRPLALESISLLAGTFSTLRKHVLPDEETRATLLFASMLAGMVIAHTGTTAVHAMGYPLTYYRNIDHGRANGLVMEGYLRFIEKDNHRVREILSAMGLESVEGFGELMSELLGPAEKLSDEEIRLFTSTASGSKNMANTFPSPSTDDVHEMMKYSFRNRQ